MTTPLPDEKRLPEEVSVIAGSAGSIIVLEAMLSAAGV